MARAHMVVDRKWRAKHAAEGSAGSLREKPEIRALVRVARGWKREPSPVAPRRNENEGRFR